ncbi:MAG: YitT family protein [Oscillospiraceae bacterium]|nr:YitT family protein [Oscillospiraceae bacterium]
MKNKVWSAALDVLKTAIGCALFALGFDLFLAPGGMNAGGLSGLAMIFVHLTNIASVGVITALLNVPLFILAGVKIGKKFFFGSLIGMLFTSLFIDLLALLPVPEVEPLLGAIYGGVICGAGLGFVFAAGVSTGGSDIIVRLLKLKYRHVPIGVISMSFDAVVAILTGVVFHDVNSALYTGIAIYISGKIIDMVVYSFDYSTVALIITKNYEQVAQTISDKLERGATYLHGEGTYSRNQTKVVLTAVKKQQVAELKELVVDIDPDAFIIVQEAHQVLGDGFIRYSKDSL